MTDQQFRLLRLAGLPRRIAELERCRGEITPRYDPHQP
jgi:hypothetical protein